MLRILLGINWMTFLFRSLFHTRVPDLLTNEYIDEIIHYKTELDRHHAYLRLAEEFKLEDEIIHLEKLLNVSNRLAIIGGAGCGKSIMAAYLACTLADAVVTGAEPPHLQTYHSQRSPSDFDTVPRLLRLSAQISNQGPFCLPNQVYQRPQRRSWIPRSFFERLMQSAPCMVILDGLDEVLSKNERQLVRKFLDRLSRIIHHSSCPHRDCQRVRFLQENALFGDDFSQLYIQSLAPELIDTLIRKWCSLLKDFGAKGHRDLRLPYVIPTCVIHLRNLDSLNFKPIISHDFGWHLFGQDCWGYLEIEHICVSLHVERSSIPGTPSSTSSTKIMRIMAVAGRTQLQWLSRLAFEIHQEGQAGAPYL